MRTSGHTVLVTGGTRGIGLAIAEKFHDSGNRVIVVGSSEQSVSTVMDAHPDWSAYACDLADMDARNGLLAWLEESHADLSVVVNNAGVQNDSAIRSGDMAALRQELAINVEAVVHLCQGVTPLLDDKAEAAIVNVSSGLAITPKAGVPVYCASKAFVRSYSVALRHLLAEREIRVFDLAPPVVKTDMTAGRNDGAMSSEDLAETFWRAWKSNREYIPAGQTRMLELIHFISPALAHRIVNKK